MHSARYTLQCLCNAARNSQTDFCIWGLCSFRRSTARRGCPTGGNMLHDLFSVSKRALLQSGDKTLLPELAIYAATMYMQWAQTTVRSVTFCKNVRQETHKSTWKCMSAFPANTPLGLLEPLKDSRQTQNAKIRSMEFPRRSSQHGEAPARKHRTSTDFHIKILCAITDAFHCMSCMQHFT